MPSTDENKAAEKLSRIWTQNYIIKMQSGRKLTKIPIRNASLFYRTPPVSKNLYNEQTLFSPSCKKQTAPVREWRLTRILSYNKTEEQ